MEFVLKFLTETLSGTTYVVVVVVAVILFFACIGFLAERSILRKKKMEQYAKADSNVSNQPVTKESISSGVVNNGSMIPNTPVTNQVPRFSVASVSSIPNQSMVKEVQSVNQSVVEGVANQSMPQPIPNGNPPVSPQQTPVIPEIVPATLVNQNVPNSNINNP